MTEVPTSIIATDHIAPFLSDHLKMRAIDGLNQLRMSYDKSKGWTENFICVCVGGKAPTLVLRGKLILVDRSQPRD